MTSRTLRRGDFVWCKYPEREAPHRPGPRHIGYIAAVGAARDLAAVVAFTTSRPWPPGPLPLGVFAFDAQQSAAFGQDRPFVLDLRRLAVLPVTDIWFPGLSLVGNGVVGRASIEWEARFKRVVEELALRHPEIIERLGPI